MTNCHTRSYPSHGGIVLGTFTGVELEWLGLPGRSPCHRSSDPREEDEFCYQMLRLGARWWESSVSPEEVGAGHRWPSVTGVLSPTIACRIPSSGGLWVLKVVTGDFGPDEFVRVIMAFIMDEWCAALEELRAMFYADVKDCPGVAKSLEDGMAIGKPYESSWSKTDG